MAVDTANPDRPAFVLHDHRKPRPHFDLRLEEGGVLRSWAVPRGLPTDPADNRLAVEVADHDLEHLTYEDEDKSIADIGWWEEHDRNERRMVFTLHGRRERRPLRADPDVTGLAVASDKGATRAPSPDRRGARPVAGRLSGQLALLGRRSTAAGRYRR